MKIIIWRSDFKDFPQMKENFRKWISLGFFVVAFNLSYIESRSYQ
jgi:predicted alpha/beta-hydrolase family hydrolase